MLFNHVGTATIVRPFVEKLDREDGHYYKTDKGQIYPSITTILKSFSKEGIDAWRNRIGFSKAEQITKESTEVGNMLHKLIEKYLNNQPSPSVKEYEYAVSPVKLFETVQPTLDQISDIYALETPIYSDEMGLAGTPDCIAKFQNKLSIIDFKNSRKLKTKSYIKNYFLQATSYSKMWKECTGIDIDQGVIIIANWDDSKGNMTSQTFKFNINDYMSELWQLIIDFDKKLI